MFVTVECEASLVGCQEVRLDVDAHLPCALALPGADHVLEALPKDRWALLSEHDHDRLRAHLDAAGLPRPTTIVVTGAQVGVAHYLAAAEALGTDPHMCLSFEDSAAGVATAREAGMQVVGVASREHAALDDADFVVPSLLSVRVIGTHPFLVFEVDAIPGVGTHASRRR